MSQSPQDLDRIWRERILAARKRYENAAQAFRAIWGEHFDGKLTTDGRFAIQQAGKIESDALAEYIRALKAYTELMLTGRVPDQPVDRKAPEPGSPPEGSK